MAAFQPLIRTDNVTRLFSWKSPAANDIDRVRGKVRFFKDDWPSLISSRVQLVQDLQCKQQSV